jgi:hypothetical protein
MENLLPYLIFLLCPLIHLLLMRGMHDPKKCPQKSRESAEIKPAAETNPAAEK